jgi:hypothetical protein
LVDGGVKGHQAIGVSECVGADDEVGEDAPWSFSMYGAATAGVTGESRPSLRPDGLVKLVVDLNACLLKKAAEEGCADVWASQPFGVDHRRDEEATVLLALHEMGGDALSARITNE